MLEADGGISSFFTMFKELLMMPEPKESVAKPFFAIPLINMLFNFLVTRLPSFVEALNRSVGITLGGSLYLIGI